MNRNTEAHFSSLPSIDIQRSIFNRDSTHITTFNTGELIPIYVDEILPGDTVSITTKKVVRLQTLLTPIMDNMYLDTYWFFVPNRLLWKHWEEFCGANKTGPWVPQTTYSVPKISSPENGWSVGSIADYMGIPVGVEFEPDGEAPNLNYDHFPTSLPFRAYAMICNEFFRDENLTDPLVIPDGDAMQTGSNGSNYITDVANGGKPFKVAKYHDYFTSALPSPQKGDPVSISINSGYSGDLMLKYFPNATVPESYTIADFPKFTQYVPEDVQAQKFNLRTGTPLTQFYGGSGNNGMLHRDNFDGTISSTSQYFYAPNKFGVTIPNTGTASFDINQLRLAFATQKMLERNARGGTRYIEILKSHFGVTSPDARLQRPEYLGGNRVPLQIHQVTNSAQSEADFLGDLGAMSYTADVHADIEHSFVEHGYLCCCCCVRYDHTYSQGLNKMWTRNSFTDFYLPVFANIGEQPIMSDEIYCDGSKPDVFGYQEAWASYRYFPNRVSSEMRPGVTGSLASWHLGDYYQSKPTLSDSWIRENLSNVDRVLAVTSAVSNQILADFYFEATYTRPMPMYSIPGLIDHN